MIKIHGKIKQEKRSKRFAGFVTAEKGILCTTDVMARGVDFENVEIIL